MKRVNAILIHPLYKLHYQKLEQTEQDRIFCCHQIPHLMDVARIAYILNLERQLGLEKEVIYAAALLHDIGKSLQYKEEIPHEIAGRGIAAEILYSLPTEVAFSAEESKDILDAVRGHRKLREDPNVLEQLLYESDKASRLCFACPAEAKCNWSKEKKNMEITI